MSLVAPRLAVGRAVALAGLATLAVAALLPRAARAAELTVTLDPEAATVGDRVQAELLLSAGQGELDGDPRSPVWGDRWGGAEIVEAGPVERLRGGAGGAPRFRQRLVLAAFRTGTVELPPKQVAVPGREATEELWTPAGLALEIDSVLPTEAEGKELEPRPPAPPEPLPLGRAFWWTLAALTGLAAGALLLIRRRREVPRSARRPPTPGEELEASLVAAGQAPAPAEGHVLLSLGLRRFLGRRFGFPAAESTTGEIRRQLRRRRCPPALEGRIHEVLQACDRVKFAREPVAAPALEARIEAAREIGRGVDDHLRPTAPEGGAGPESGAGHSDGPRREEAA